MAVASDHQSLVQSRPAQFVLRRLGDRMAQLCIVVAGMALLAIVAVNGANVVGRYFLGSPISWAEELMLFLMVLVVFAGAAAVTWRGAHIRIEIFVDWLSPILQWAAAFVTGLLAVSVLVVTSVVSFEIVSTLYAFDQRSDALELPIWIPQSFVTIGSALMAVMLLLRFGCALQSLTNSQTDSAVERAMRP
jgi:TRAP-type C4-dicarboxylate transport system permease small subunit